MAKARRSPIFVLALLALCLAPPASARRSVAGADTVAVRRPVVEWVSGEPVSAARHAGHEKAFFGSIAISNPDSVPFVLRMELGNGGFLAREVRPGRYEMDNAFPVYGLELRYRNRDEVMLVKDISAGTVRVTGRRGGSQSSVNNDNAGRRGGDNENRSRRGGSPSSVNNDNAGRRGGNLPPASAGSENQSRRGKGRDGNNGKRGRRSGNSYRPGAVFIYEAEFSSIEGDIQRYYELELWGTLREEDMRNRGAGKYRETARFRVIMLER